MKGECKKSSDKMASPCKKSSDKMLGECKSCLRGKRETDIVKHNVYKPKKMKECKSCFDKAMKRK